jgi:tRNA-uridine 2-sulfurtransferase
MEKSSNKVLVAMSGGVDSSVAAYLLKRDGFSIIGATMYLGVTDPDGHEACSEPQAVKDARSACDQLGISHYAVDLSKEFHDNVITNFVHEYAAGRTPNPCVQCNKYLKFHELLKYAQRLGCESIATGHYARMGTWDGQTVLMRNRDPVKDQSYFLYGISSANLDSIIFPLSDLKKKDVRAIARDADLHVAEKSESQEICFITDNDYRNFLHRNGINDTPGIFFDTKGKKLGYHKGVFNYTIGQRKGLGIAAGVPLYVIAIDTLKNTVIVGGKEELFAYRLEASDVNMLVASLPGECTAKVRSTQMDIPCTAILADGLLRVTFKTPVEAVTPGQSVVLYHGDIVLGGGIIRNVYQ